MSVSGAFVSHQLAQVPSAMIMDGIAQDAERVGLRVQETYEAVNQEWIGFEDAFVLLPRETPARALEPTLVSVGIYAEVMARAKQALSDAAWNVFRPLAVRREDLVGRMADLNDRHAAHQSIWDAEMGDFFASPSDTSGSGPDTSAFRNADVNLGILDEEASWLSSDVVKFHADLAEAESSLASTLRGLDGGDEISGPDGSVVNVSQSFWGVGVPGAYPSVGDSVTMAEFFDRRIGEIATSRISWLSRVDPAQATEWITEHPDFLSTIGFTPPERAEQLFEKLQNASVHGDTGAWVAGPLAQLWSLAPGVIGNLNGLKAVDRSPFARRELERLLDDPMLSDDQQDKLKGLRREADLDGRMLLSVFLDTDGDPRASMAWGDVDTADQVVTLTHGIATDLGQLDEWATISSDISWQLGEQLRFRAVEASTAVVLFMEWDSGSMLTVQDDELAEAGASREVALVEGFRHINPDARQEGWAHSLGTTQIAEAIAQSPGIFDHLTLFGSAGATPEGGEAITDQIDSGDLTVSATSSDLDWIALHGRHEWLSEHAIDPRTLTDPDTGAPVVDVFGSDGGVVENFHTANGAGSPGLPTQGHNAGASDDVMYRIHRSPGWMLSLMPDDSVGYLDKRSQSFKQAIADLADRMEQHE